uniref:ECM11 domain-containing protein n=1 Tax=Rhabditophanes sp. KR3021 TaxID=114890 RepID=A0AC35TQQ2_9BILA
MLDKQLIKDNFVTLKQLVDPDINIKEISGTDGSEDEDGGLHLARDSKTLNVASAVILNPFSSLQDTIPPPKKGLVEIDRDDIVSTEKDTDDDDDISSSLTLGLASSLILNPLGPIDLDYEAINKTCHQEQRKASRKTSITELREEMKQEALSNKWRHLQKEMRSIYLRIKDACHSYSTEHENVLHDKESLEYKEWSDIHSDLLNLKRSIQSTLKDLKHHNFEVKGLSKIPNQFEVVLEEIGALL